MDKIACDYLLAKGMDEEFVKYLSTYKWKGTMYAMPEGTVAYPNDQMVRIKCDAIGAILIETYLLQTMNFNSLITTKSTKIVRATDNGKGEWEPRMKCSDTLSKAIIQGYKMVYRLYDEDGRGYLDLIAMNDEKIEIGKEIKVYTTDLNDSQKEYKITPKVIKPLLVPYIEDGKLVRDMPSIQEIRDYIKDQLENKVWPEELRTSNPHVHYVDMTEKVYNLRTDMYNRLHGQD